MFLKIVVLLAGVWIAVLAVVTSHLGPFERAVMLALAAVLLAWGARLRWRRSRV